MQAPVPVIILSGSMGAGKTTVLYAASELLSTLGVAHGTIDVDAFTTVYPPTDRFNSELAFACLAAVWPVYAAAGATRLLLARAVQQKARLERYRTAIPGAQIIVCRLTAPVPVMQERVRRRDKQLIEGPEWSAARAAELDGILTEARVEDYAVDNNGERTPAEVAHEVLVKAGWLPS